VVLSYALYALASSNRSIPSSVSKARKPSPIVLSTSGIRDRDAVAVAAPIEVDFPVLMVVSLRAVLTIPNVLRDIRVGAPPGSHVISRGRVGVRGAHRVVVV